MKVLICGGRDFTDRRFLFEVMSRITIKKPITLVIEGGACGADRLAREWANSHGVAVATYPANWELHGRRAGPARNCRMLREARPDLVVAFKGGTGTAHMVRISEEAGVRTLRTWKYKDDV